MGFTVGHKNTGTTAGVLTPAASAAAKPDPKVELTAEFTKQFEVLTGHPPSEEEFQTYIQPHMADAEFDITKSKGREAVAARVQRSMPIVKNAYKATATETKQEDFQTRLLTQYEEASKQGTELAKKQMAILEEQLGMSKKELESLQEARTKALEQADVQAASAKTTQNEMYRQAGLKPEYDDRGVLTGLAPMAEDELIGNMTPLQQQQYSIAKQTSQKQLDALAGKVDMDPALQQSLAEQEQQLRTVLAQKLGPNYERSTPGIQALSKFGEAKTRIEESARLSWIQTGQGLVTQAVGTQQGIQQGAAGAAAAAAGTGAQLGQVGITAPLSTAPVNRGIMPGEVSGVLATSMAPMSAAPTIQGGYQNILAPNVAFQQQQYSLQQIQAQKPPSESPWGGVLAGLVGTGISAAATYYAGKPPVPAGGTS